jgi:hypothetical protein
MSNAGAVPDSRPRCAWQLLCFREAHDADYAFVEDGLADLGHEWWFSATWPLQVSWPFSGSASMPDHGFRIYSLSFMVVGGCPRFRWGGYWFSPVDPPACYLLLAYLLPRAGVIVKCSFTRKRDRSGYRAPRFPWPPFPSAGSQVPTVGVPPCCLCRVVPWHRRNTPRCR